MVLRRLVSRGSEAPGAARVEIGGSRRVEQRPAGAVEPAGA